jgi:hypothetical protein
MPPWELEVRTEARTGTAGRALLVNSLGADAGRGNLGESGYSYDIVLRAFLPLLRRWGEVTHVARPESQVDFAIRRARRRGQTPISLSFRPFPDVYLTRNAANVVYPFWEFPDVPDSDLHENPRNNWVRAAGRAALILCASEFTAKALVRAGVRAPVRVVPVPVHDDYLGVEPWAMGRSATLDCTAYVFANEPRGQRGGEGERAWPPPRVGVSAAITTHATSLARRLWVEGIKPRCSSRLAEALIAAKNAGVRTWRDGGVRLPSAREQVELQGVVYTTVFNPDDQRKNWLDVLTAFLAAVGERDDAMLVLKLATSRPASIYDVVNRYCRLGWRHRARVAFVTSYLTDEQMRVLTSASTYYLSATRAEGACLPLMDFLAAGRPGISPAHTSIADYFDADVGFVVASHREPCAWPQDTSGKLSTTWHRLDWASLVEQVRASYELATRGADAYGALSTRARERMAEKAGSERVWPRLSAALSEAERSSAWGSAAATDKPLSRQVS